LPLEHGKLKCSFHQRRATTTGKVDKVKSDCDSANEDFNGSGREEDVKIAILSKLAKKTSFDKISYVFEA
jgi:hypothetical protein